MKRLVLVKIAAWISSMRKNFFEYAKCLAILLIVAGFFSCSKQSTEDKVKIVEMTIYPETGYGRSLLSEIWTDALFFSESDDPQKSMFLNIITEGFDFEYERGYEYSFKAKKVWMKNPPMDVSSIKYQFVGSLSKKKKITENSEESIVLFVSSEMVKYGTQFPIEYEDEIPKIYDALLVKETNSNWWSVIREIEGFDYEIGYEYSINIKKITQAEPYLVRYVLLEIKDKQKK